MRTASLGSSRSTKRFPAAAIAFPNKGISPSSRLARNPTGRGNADRSIGMSTTL